ncbi:Ape1p [Sugiyamaella lignohabitans]|uniref:Ape1p n=1 Tax=Sugiyamaella lignohabitans TaxID=796027 RepID=A0A167EWJ2_9ASCO|nr:Ape1p [Sugiyamaella lignohabitans]ANB14543.1 Ape1p [Sugiyamaella lignohabitans]
MGNNYSEAFIKAIYENPTVYHWCNYTSEFLTARGFQYLPERENWDGKIKRGGSYYTTRNGSSIVAFKIGSKWKLGDNGVGVIGCHIDALTAKIKPISKKAFKQGYRQLGVAPYSGGMSSVWWDRDLSIGGRVIVKSQDGSFSTKLAHVEHPIARIPTLAEHFGKPSEGPFNKETQMTPIIGHETTDEDNATDEEKKSPLYGRHDIKLLRAIAQNVGVSVSELYQLELELFDSQPGALGGLDREFMFCPRLDDKLCSFGAIQALVETSAPSDAINCVALFDNEEIGSLLRQGAKGGLFQHAIQRVFQQLGDFDDDYLRQTFANSFFISSDVTHAVNPNFSDSYLENHKPKLNTGLVVKLDPNGHTTSDGVSTAFIEEVARRTGNKLQYFHIRNDGVSGGTIGPMFSSATGIRSVDAGIPQLSMHSIRATTGSRDLELGVKMYSGFFNTWTSVDADFRKGDI